MSNRELPMMPWFPKEFMAATSTWSFAERAAYRALLDVQWEMGVLPDEPWRLAQAIGMDLAHFAEVWPMVRTKFVKVEGGIRNERCEEHRIVAFRKKQGHKTGAETTNAKRRAGRDANRDAERLAQSAGAKRSEPVDNSASGPGGGAGTGYPQKPAQNLAERDAERTAERDGKRVASDTPPSPSPSSKTPLPPQSGGSANGAKRGNGTNLRAQGENPRAVAERAAEEERWQRLRERARATNFRDPRPADTLDTYETSLRMHERDHHGSLAGD